MITLRLLQRSALCLVTGVLCAGCNHGPAAPAPSAPAAEKPKAESILAQTTISRAAQKSLGLQTTPVRVETVQEQRTLTGWIMVRPGAEVIVNAPVGGYLQAPTPPAVLPVPGLPVREGQELFRLEPVLTAVEQNQLTTQHRGFVRDLNTALETAKVADNELKRVEKLFKEQLRGLRDLEQARLALKAAEEDVAAAQFKLKNIMAPDAGKGDFRPAPETLKAPRAGVVLALLANPGQFVPAAAPLASIADLSRPWVRVPVPEHDLPRVDRSRPAQIAVLPEGPRDRGAALVHMQAEPVALVPQVDPIKHTADLIYDLKPPTENGALAKDQMVSVAVPIGGRTSMSIVPYAAILYDAYGGTWIYIDRTPKDAETCVYERVRVELGPPLGNDIAVRPALKAGDPVVSEGAAALFSREFYRPPVPVVEAPKGK
jgi:RND family efflux transporter MFP subunit